MPSIIKILSNPLSLLATLPAALAENTTVSNSQLNTWWHDEGVVDFKGPISDNSVRQSHLYSVQVAPANDTSIYYDSFVYESIPRNGNGPIIEPNDRSTIQATPQDGITIEPILNTTMAWTQFLYSADVSLKISRIDDHVASASSTGVTIRPTTLNYTITKDNDSVYIHVPYVDSGTRFSIEFDDDQLPYHTMTSTQCANELDYEGDCSYVQGLTNNVGNYFPQLNSSMPLVGREPRSALLIFASPFPADDHVARQDDSHTLIAKPGLVTGLDKTDASTVSFPPGVYYFSSTAHAILAESVTWVYLAPGAYVKGALEFTAPNAPTITVSGFGVLSGEQYVYQANPSTGYSSTKSDTSSLKMFRGVYQGSQHQTFTLTGITLANPCFNSMDFYNNINAISVQAWDYKQVGAWFDQTDGLENYPGSYVRDVFYHSSDDTLKLYHPNVTIENVVVWKKTNGATVQLGWMPRNVSGISVSNIDIIHSRYASNDVAGTTGDALIMSTVFPNEAKDMNTADVSAYLSNVAISNIRAEGINPALLRLSPLMNYDGLTIEDAWIEELSPTSTGLQMSWARKWTDGSQHNTPVSFGSKSEDGVGVRVKNFMVGEEKVSFTDGNWDATSLGAMNFDDSFWGHWSVE